MKDSPMMISLIGMPGCGKSTIGRQLAKRLHVAFFDSDQAIEQQQGCSVRALFDQEGEARFRDLESGVIDDLTLKSDGVLATGGGAVLRMVNRLNLRQRTRVVYLNASPYDLFVRLHHDKNRPLLQVPDVLGQLRLLHSQRHGLYCETAHFSLDIGRPSVATVVNMILMQIELG